MPPRVLANTARVEMIYNEGTQERANVFHVEVTGAADPDLAAIADAFDGHDAAYGTALRTPITLLNRIVVTNISTSLQSQYTKPITPPRPGTATGNSSPGNVTSTVSWRSLFVGRQFRGRTYMVETPIDQVTPSETINGARASALATWASNLLGALSALGHVLKIASFTHNAAYGVVSAVIETILDSQRRRLPGRGR